jgi:hypothetical protein
MESQCQEGSFPDQFKKQNPLITTGSGKENKEGIQERRRVAKRNRKKNTSEEDETRSERGAVTCAC